MKEESIFYIEVERIKPNPSQPRREFDEQGLNELSASIREYGILQPLLVSKVEEEHPFGVQVYYQIIAGERRWRAAKLAGFPTVPAIIHETDPKRDLELALIENIQREDLNSLETALAFDRLINEFQLTHQDIANRLGKSRSHISNTLRILTLPPEIKAALAKKLITEGHTKIILAIREPEKQKILFNEIVNQKLSVRTAAALLKRMLDPSLKEEVAEQQIVDPVVQNLIQKLEENLGTKILLASSGQKTKLTIEFYSPEELHHTLQKLIKEPENTKSASSEDLLF